MRRTIPQRSRQHAMAALMVILIAIALCGKALVQEYPVTEVSIDGLVGDWSDYRILKYDYNGDASGGGFDLKSVRAFTNDRYLYLMLDAHGDIGEYVQIDVDIDADGDGDQDYMATFQPRTGRRDFGDFTSGEGNWRSMEGGSAAEGEVVELKMPLGLIGGCESPTLLNIRVMNGVCCGEQWRTVDYMGPVFVARSNETEAPLLVPRADAASAAFTHMIVDGRADDWIERPLLLSEPEGNARAGFVDMTTGYGFVNQHAVYLLVEVADASASVTQFMVWFKADSRALVFAWSVDDAFGVVSEEMPNGNLVSIGQAIHSDAAFGPALEMRIDLRDLEMPEEMLLESVNAMSVDVPDGAVDVWGPATRLSRVSEADPSYWIEATSVEGSVRHFEPPPGYEGSLDNLRQVVPIWRPPLVGPIGLTINGAGTRAYVIEKGLHRLSWVDIDQTSPTYASITPITEELDDPQMAVALDMFETHAYVVENSPGTLKRVSLDTGRVTTVSTGLAYPIDVALSSDETTAYVTQFDGSLVAVSIENGSVTAVTTHMDSPCGLALSPDGSTAYVAEPQRGPVKRVDLRTGVVSDIEGSDVRAAYDLAVSSSGRHLYVVDAKDRLVRRIDLETGTLEVVVPDTGERVEAIALSPDESRLYATQWGPGRLLQFDLEEGHAESVFPMIQGPSSVVMNRDGTRLYVVESSSGELSTLDIDPASSRFGALSPLASNVVPQDMLGVILVPAANAAESWLLLACGSNLRRIDLQSGTVTDVVWRRFSGATSVVLSQDETVAYVGDKMGLWSVDTKTWEALLVAETRQGIGSLALARDEGCLYATQHQDLREQGLDQFNPRPLTRISLPDGQVTELSANIYHPRALALNPDGRHAVVLDDQEAGPLVQIDLRNGETINLPDIRAWAPTDRYDPTGVAVGRDGTLFVASSNWTNDDLTCAGAVCSVTAEGPWRLEILAEPSLFHPLDMEINRDGEWLYVLQQNGAFHRIGLPGGSHHGELTPIMDTVVDDPHGLTLTADGSAAWVISGESLCKMSLASGNLMQSVDYTWSAADIDSDYDIVLSPDEMLAYLCTGDNRLVKIDLTTGAAQVIASDLRGPHGMAISADGGTVYVVERDAARVGAIDVATGAVTPFITGLRAPTNVAVDEEGRYAVVLENPWPDFHVTRVDLSTGDIARIFSGSRSNTFTLALTPDHTRVYFTKHMSGEVWGIDLATGRIVDNLVEALRRFTGFALSEGGQGAYTTEEFVPRIRYVDLGTGKVTTVAYLDGPAFGLALTRDEKTAYVTRMYGDDLLQVNLEDGTWMTIAEGDVRGRVVLNPSETTAFVSSWSDGGPIWAVDVGSGARWKLVDGLTYPYAMDINKAGTIIYTTCGPIGEPGDMQLLAVDALSGRWEVIATIEGGQDVPGDLTLSPDERYVYVYDQPGSLLGAGIWRVDVDSRSPEFGEVVSLARWVGELQHGEFTSDGQYLVLSNAWRDQMLRLYLGGFQ